MKKILSLFTFLVFIFIGCAQNNIVTENKGGLKVDLSFSTSTEDMFGTPLEDNIIWTTIDIHSNMPCYVQYFDFGELPLFEREIESESEVILAHKILNNHIGSVYAYIMDKDNKPLGTLFELYLDGIFESYPYYTFRRLHEIEFK